MFIINYEKNVKHTKREKIHFEEMVQTSELDSEMAGMLEWSTWEFKTTVTKMLWSLMDKLDRTWKQIVNIYKIHKYYIIRKYSES